MLFLFNKIKDNLIFSTETFGCHLHKTLKVKTFLQKNEKIIRKFIA